jgi:anti-sigma factor RsiW
MDAFFARNRLSAYLDGELTAAEARDVEAALARDPQLRTELDAMRAAVDMLRDGGIVEPPAGFAKRLAERLESEPMPVGWRRWVRQVRPEGVMLAAAALLVVIYVGNRDALPDLELPGDDVVAARTFDKGGGAEDAPTAKDDVAPPAGEAEASSPGADDKPAAPAAAAPRAPSSYGVENDGILGNEPKLAAPSKATKSAPPAPATRGKSSGMEVEQWQAAWEREAYDNTAAPEQQAQTGNTATVQWTSPPPFRYRVTASNDMAMKQLAGIAAELGGTLQDSRGRPLAAYQLDDGEARAVRVSVPAHNAARLAERLREIGMVDTINEPGNLLADPNSDVGVSIELQN